MSGKNVEDYLTEGIYGVQKPKQAERNRFLGTFRERIVFCLTIGEVMQKEGLEELIQSMKEKNDSKLLLNGKINFKYFSDIKREASNHSILYTVISNKDIDTDIGAVLYVDYAIDVEHIFLNENISKEKEDEPSTDLNKQNSLLSKLKSFFSFK